jgi:hypothetical protein
MGGCDATTSALLAFTASAAIFETLRVVEKSEPIRRSPSPGCFCGALAESSIILAKYVSGLAVLAFGAAVVYNTGRHFARH